ncbi:fluoride efflux transporter CrcB [Salinimicrobium catena]|uniref:fluoride efflux transporter CrcB n=1 Tax=Salinimicrobium catena TaxID=390640 RepID=UPI002FE44D60
MKQILLVFIGGGTGSILRYLISKSLNNATVLPLGTLVVNVVGSLLIGFILGLGYRQQMLSANVMLLLATGFCGGFTTFSAFSYENHLFLKAGDFMSVGIYTISSLVLGIAATFAGLYASRFI